MVRVTSVPDSVLAGAVKVTVPLALPPLPASMLTVLGEVEEKLRSLLTCTVNVPVASEDNSEKDRDGGIWFYVVVGLGLEK